MARFHCAWIRFSGILGRRVCLKGCQTFNRQSDCANIPHGEVAFSAWIGRGYLEAACMPLACLHFSRSKKKSDSGHFITLIEPTRNYHKCLHPRVCNHTRFPYCSGCAPLLNAPSQSVTSAFYTHRKSAAHNCPFWHYFCCPFDL